MTRIAAITSPSLAAREIRPQDPGGRQLIDETAPLRCRWHTGLAHQRLRLDGRQALVPEVDRQFRHVLARAAPRTCRIFAACGPSLPSMFEGSPTTRRSGRQWVRQSRAIASRSCTATLAPHHAHAAGREAELVADSRDRSCASPTSSAAMRIERC